MSSDEKVTTTVSKSEIAEALEITTKSLAVYCNDRYFLELEKLGYQKNQKYLTPIQVNLLKEKLGF